MIRNAQKRITTLKHRQSTVKGGSALAFRFVRTIEHRHFEMVLLQQLNGICINHTRECALRPTSDTAECDYRWPVFYAHQIIISQCALSSNGYTFINLLVARAVIVRHTFQFHRHFIVN